MKILHVLFSTNRIPYLERTLLAQQKFLDFSGIDSIHKLFIDDYPTARDNTYIRNLVKKYGFKEIILHSKNIGITSTWNELFSIIKNRNYDYILHQEDDVEPVKSINILNLIRLLKSNPSFSQIQLKRNHWFETDGPEKEWFSIKPTDIILDNYILEVNSPWFWMLMSIYPKWISEIDFLKETGNCPSEGIISEYLYTKHNLKSCIIKDINGMNLINHFGDITKGKRVNKDEPGWEKFKSFDPTKEYYSRTGCEYRNNSN